MSEMYKIKNGGHIIYGRRKITNENLTDELAEEMLKQKGMERSIVSVNTEKVKSKTSTKPDESGKGKA